MKCTTIRSIEPDAVAMIAETADTSGRSYGDRVNEVIELLMPTRFVLLSGRFQLAGGTVRFR